MARETKGSPAREQKLERYGVWVKVEPRTVAEGSGAESSLELADLEASGGAAAASSRPTLESTLTVEEEKLLDELDTELGPSETGKDLSIPEEEPVLAEEDELPEISEVGDEGPSQGSLEPGSSDELPELDLEEEPAPAPAPGGGHRRAPGESNEIEVTLSDTGVEHGRFEDLDDLESELATVAAAPAKSQIGSSEVLARIEDELRSIRADLTQLRNELSGMRKSGGASPAAQPAAGSEAQSGFFDEDEDETIALTGDELDNILNTAEITEEAAEAAPVEQPDQAAEVPEEAPTLEEISELTMPAEEGTEGELPAELELETLTPETAEATPAAASGDVLPELDLEGIPEIETTEKSAEGLEEPGNLETLDLEGEAGGTESAPGPSDLELLEEEPAAGRKGATENVEELAGEADLDALAAEAEELESDETTAPADLEIGELEAVAEDQGAAAGGEKEIEIAFETETTPSQASDEVADVEQAPSGKGKGAVKSRGKGGAAGIPDDLKDEIRTVLKYMDHLLEALPDEKIKEFAESEHFLTYKKLFEDLGLGE